MKLDPSGSYAATSCSDKNLCLLDFYTGELLATMYGHSEIPTDVRFMNDLKHVLSVSGDGYVLEMYYDIYPLVCQLFGVGLGL